MFGSLSSVELGRVAKYGMREKRVIRKWRLDMFDDEDLKRTYQDALKSESQWVGRVC